MDSLNSFKPFIAYRVLNVWGINSKKSKNIADSEKDFLNTLKANSIKYSGMLGLLAIKQGEYSEQFLKKIATVDPLGKMITFNKYYHHGNPSSPLWQGELEKIFKVLVDSGCSMIEIDQPALESWRGESYDDNTIKNFNKYLSSKYTTTELFDRFGIKDLNDFDYRNFLKNKEINSIHKNLAELNEGDRLALSPLGYDFFYFQIKDNRKNIYKLIDSIKDYSNSSGEQVKIFGNIWGMAAEYMPPASKFDYLDVACDIITPWDWNPSDLNIGPPDNSWIPVFKLARAFDKDKEIISFLDTNGYIRALKVFKNQEDFLGILSSEALGCGTNFVFPLCNRVAPKQKKTFSKEAIEKLIPFYRKNLSLFKNSKSYAKVAIFLNYKPLIAERFSRAYWGLSYILLDNQIDYDVIFSGDGDIFDDNLSLNTLNKYKLVFIPHFDLISKKQKQVFRKYIENGGKIISTGNSVINSKSFAVLNADFFSYYLRKNQKIASRTMLAISTLFPKLPIKIKETVKGLRIFTSYTDHNLNLLLVNSKYDKKSNSIIPIKNISLRISIKNKPSSVILFDRTGKKTKLKFKYRYNEIELNGINIQNTGLIKISVI